MEGGSTQVHQGVVGRLLLLAAGVTVEEVVDLISYFWKCRHGHPSVTHGDKTQLVVTYMDAALTLAYEVVESSMAGFILVIVTTS